MIGPDTFEVFTHGAATLKVQSIASTAFRVTEVVAWPSGFEVHFDQQFPAILKCAQNPTKTPAITASAS